jgi:hypothetical protein
MLAVEEPVVRGEHDERALEASRPVQGLQEVEDTRAKDAAKQTKDAAKDATD